MRITEGLQMESRTELKVGAKLRQQQEEVKKKERALELMGKGREIE